MECVKVQRFLLRHVSKPNSVKLCWTNIFYVNRFYKMQPLQRIKLHFPHTPGLLYVPYLPAKYQHAQI